MSYIAETGDLDFGMPEDRSKLIRCSSDRKNGIA